MYMRYIRNFFILFTICFFLAGALPVSAVDSLFSVSGCNDPSQTCATTGDGVNTIVPLSQTQTLIANTAAQLLGPKNIITKIFGSLKPLGSYNTGSEKLTNFSNQIQTASDFELNPASLQSIEQHDETSKSASMTSRECVYNPQTGALEADIVSGETIITADVPWIRPGAEGARRLSSFTTGYTQESQDYNLPNITIKQNAALPCGSQLSGIEKNQNPTAFQNENTYGGPGNGTISFVVNVLNSMIKLFTSPEGSASAKADITVQAHIVGTAQNPYTGHTAALTAGCATSSDLSSVSYATDEQKRKLCESGGFVNSMYRQDQIDPTYKSDLNAKDPNQQWVQTITNDQPTAANSSAFAARVEAAGDYTNCTLTQADYQTTAVPDGACNTNWVGSAAAGGGWNCSNVGERSVPGLNSGAGQSYANILYGPCTSGKENAWEKCKNDVIARAAKACVDPVFALAIWLHESGASNYTCGQQLSGGKVQDFGVNISSVAENFSEQLDRFLQLPGYYGSKCSGKTMQDFVAMFWIGDGCYNTLSSANKAKIDGYITELQGIYSVIAPGKKLPKWPGGC